MPKISVIVPAYNIELYIGKCIDTLANQTLDDLEIIIINDGSTDRTEDVIKKKIEKYSDKNIVLFNKENGGQSDARNYGIKNATGDYITFVDGDDYVEPDMFEQMYKKVLEYPYDIVMCDVSCRYPNKSLEIKSGMTDDKKSMGLQDRKEIILSSYAVVWNKIYKKELITEDKFFVKDLWYEDVLFIYKLFPYINSVGVVNKKLYNYVQRQNSITYTYNDKLYDVTKVLNELIQYYDKQGLKHDYDDILEFVYIRYMYATFIKRLAKSKDKRRFRDGVNFAIKHVNEMYPKYKKNKFLSNKSIKNFYLKNFNRFFANIIYGIEKNRMN